MRHTLFVFCLSVAAFMLSHASFAQQDKTLDRLLAAPDDTAKVGQLLRHGRKVQENSYEQAEVIYGKAYEISKKIGFDEGLGKSLLNLAGVVAYQGNFKKALQNAQLAYGYFVKVGEKEGLASCHSSLAALHGTSGNIDSAMYHIDKALALLGDKDPGPLSWKLNLNLGVLHNSLKNFEKATLYYSRALEVAQSLQDTAMITQSLGSLTSGYINRKDFDKAYAYAIQALQLAERKGDLKGLAIAHQRYASACNRIKKLEEAEVSALKSMAYFEQLNDVQLYLLAARTLSDTYGEMGKLEKAISVLEKASAMGEEKKLFVPLQNVYDALAEHYLRNGSYKQAYETLEKHQLLKDSLVNDANKKAAAELEIKYETARTEKELAQNKVELLQQNLLLQETKQWVIYSIAATLIALLVAGLVYVNLLHKRRIHVRQLQTLQQEKEIQLLQALMQGEEKERSRIARDLHDGVAGMLAASKMHFSTLAEQLEFIDGAEGFQQGLQLLDEATREVRLTSHNLMPEVLLQQGLDVALSRYCSSVNNKELQLQYYSLGQISRFSSGFELSIYRIVQELVNNMIKHSKATEGLVQIAQQENMLSITIEDNGIGFGSGEAKQDGTGLNSLYTRVKAMNGILEIEGSAQRGVSAYMEFDVSTLIQQQQEVQLSE